MKEQFIPELGVTLAGRALAVWLGVDAAGNPIPWPAEQVEAERQAIRDRVKARAPQLRQTDPRPKGGCGCRKTS